MRVSGGRSNRRQLDRAAQNGQPSLVRVVYVNHEFGAQIDNFGRGRDHGEAFGRRRHKCRDPTATERQTLLGVDLPNGRPGDFQPGAARSASSTRPLVSSYALTNPGRIVGQLRARSDQLACRSTLCEPTFSPRMPLSGRLKLPAAEE